MSCLILDEVLKSGQQSLPNGLCPACQPLLDFVMEGGEARCDNHRHSRGPHLHTRDEYHANTTTCPGCRLISSFFRLDKEKTSNAPAKNLIIQQRNFDVSEEPDSDFKVSLCGGLVVSIKSGRQNPPGGEYGRDVEDPQGRIVPPIVNIDLVRSWMRSSNSNHQQCNQMSAQVSAPLRLIDLKHSRVIEADSSYRYTALSYVWGKTTKPLMTRETLPKILLKGGLQCINVPRTIMDAMQFTEDLGYRFMWVDSICIVQDDADDKKMQLPNMSKIYRDADLVIAAATGNSAHAGLSGVGSNVRKSWQQIESLGPWEFITTDPKISVVMDETDWNTRGWTFQEAYLARRILLFAENQVFWICKNMSWREDTHFESQPKSPESSGLESLWGSANEYDESNFKVRCRTREYCRNVEIFSERKFKDERDSLWAFTGILEAQAKSFPQGYIWAMPFEILDAALLWEPYLLRCGCGDIFQENIQSHLTGGVTRDAISYPVPSWAWLSSKNGVRLRESCGDLVSEVSWLPPIEPKRPYNLLSWMLVLTQPSRALKRPHTLPKANTDLTNLDIQYKYLHFSANMARLTVKLVENSKDSDTGSEGNDKEPRHLLGPWWKRLFKFDRLQEAMSSLSHFWKSREVAAPKEILRQATIILSGEEIGRFRVPEDYMRNDSERLGQFVLLSSNTQDKSDDHCIVSSSPLDCGNIIHLRNCDHIVSHNVMLVEWHGRIAYRRALVSINKEDWAKVEVRKRDVILG
ncbi:hypothetical protein G7054_g4550 [Neopestalotiopsis clavispora]|nr:hypothetical protein G7054_g4550 [Neopestalotiopsis clavispora]